MTDEVEKKSRLVRIKKTVSQNKLVSALVVLVLIFATTSAYFYIRANTGENKADKQAVSALNALNIIMQLPTDEKPILATIEDIQKLQGQAFYKDAANGDTIVIFPTSRKVILFRSSTNKIINFGFIEPNDPLLQKAKAQ